MAQKKQQKTEEHSTAQLQAKIAELEAQLKGEQKQSKTANASAERHRVAAEKAKTAQKEAEQLAKEAKKDALADLGPSVIVVLSKESKTGDGTVLPKDAVIGVLHIHDKINTDYLVSAIQNGRAKPVPGITDGVFQMADLIALRDRNAELEADLQALLEDEEEKEVQDDKGPDDKKSGGKKGGESS